MPALPKPERRRTAKARKDRHEAAVIAQVRAACVERDGHCRIAQRWMVNGTVEQYDIGCDGLTQWTHLPPKTRAHTINLEPEERHGTAWTIMACQRHHDMIDGRRQPRIVVRCLTPDGADGPISVELK